MVSVKEINKLSPTYRALNGLYISFVIQTEYQFEVAIVGEAVYRPHAFSTTQVQHIFVVVGIGMNVLFKYICTRRVRVCVCVTVDM